MYMGSTLLFRCGCVIRKMAKFVCDPVRMTVVGPEDIVFIITCCAVDCSSGVYLLLPCLKYYKIVNPRSSNGIKAKSSRE
jgi:hypothetical protein